MCFSLACFLKIRNYQSSGNQIDRNYEGENKDSLSQNRYAYTLNNPYKYIDKDGNRNTYNPNGIGYENLTSAYSDRGADLVIKKHKNLSKAEFTKKLKGFTKTQKARAMKAWDDAHPSTKKAEVYGPPAPARVQGPTQKTPSNPEPTTPPKTGITNPGSTNKTTAPKIEICPAKWSLEDWKDFIVNAFNWKELFKNLVAIYKSGFKIIDSGMITNYAKEHTILDVPMNIKGVKDTVKTMTGLSSGTRATLGQTVKTTFGAQMKDAFKNMGVVGAIITFGIDVTTAFVKALFGMITWLRFIIDSVVSVVYNAIQILAVTAVKALLTPFIGPFAWIIGLILDVGLTWIEWFIDLKAKIGDFVEWIITSDYNNATKMVTAVSKKL